MSERADVVVAIDASEGSMVALDWACAYAELAGVGVTALHVWSYPERGPRTGVSENFEVMEREALDGVIEQVDTYISTHSPRVAIDPKVVEGSVVDELVDQSHRADLLVVGCRGRGALASTLLGSVSKAVAERAHCPVVVIHRHDRVHRPGGNDAE